MTFHEIQPSWYGSPAFIIAGGPSLYGFQSPLFTAHHTIAINNSYTVHPTADYLIFCDVQWWSQHRNTVLSSFHGQPITITTIPDYLADGVIRLRNAGRTGLSHNPQALYHGTHTGYQAINLAYLLGADPIYLLGYDLRTWTWADAADFSSYSFINDAVAERVYSALAKINATPALATEPCSSHWHRGHGGTIRHQSQQLHDVMLPQMDTLAVELGKAGVRCYNCTPKSAMRCFEYRPIADVLSTHSSPQLDKAVIV